MTRTFSSTRSISGVAQAGRPKGPRGLARVILVLAWVAFALNTALAPCCEAVAAALAGHSRTVSAAEPPPHSDATPSERPHDSPGSPCGYVIDAGPAGLEVHAVPSTHSSFDGWLAIDAAATPGPAAVETSTTLAPRERHLPPLRIYLRTLRLRI